MAEYFQQNRRKPAYHSDKAVVYYSKVLLLSNIASKKHPFFASILTLSLTKAPLLFCSTYTYA